LKVIKRVAEQSQKPQFFICSRCLGWAAHHAAIIIGLSVLLCACSGNGTSEPSAVNSKPSYNIISAEEAKQMMKGNSDFVLLDVRTEEEYREKRLNGAVLIPYNEIADRAESELPNKDKLIFVYCRTGVRAALAAQLLADMGYTNVYDIGGILDWTYGTVGG